MGRGCAGTFFLAGARAGFSFALRSGLGKKSQQSFPRKHWRCLRSVRETSINPLTNYKSRREHPQEPRPRPPTHITLSTRRQCAPGLGVLLVRLELSCQTIMILPRITSNHSPLQSQFSSSFLHYNNLAI